MSCSPTSQGTPIAAADEAKRQLKRRNSSSRRAAGRPPRPFSSNPSSSPHLTSPSQRSTSLHSVCCTPATQPKPSPPPRCPPPMRFGLSSVGSLSLLSVFGEGRATTSSSTSPPPVQVSAHKKNAQRVRGTVSKRPRHSPVAVTSPLSVAQSSTFGSTSQCILPGRQIPSPQVAKSPHVTKSPTLQRVGQYAVARTPISSARRPSNPRTKQSCGAPLDRGAHKRVLRTQMAHSPQAPNKRTPITTSSRARSAASTSPNPAAADICHPRARAFHFSPPPALILSPCCSTTSCPSYSSAMIAHPGHGETQQPSCSSQRPPLAPSITTAQSIMSVESNSLASQRDSATAELHIILSPASWNESDVVVVSPAEVGAATSSVEAVYSRHSGATFPLSCAADSSSATRTAAPASNTLESTSQRCEATVNQHAHEVEDCACHLSCRYDQSTTIWTHISDPEPRSALLLPGSGSGSDDVSRAQPQQKSPSGGDFKDDHGVPLRTMTCTDEAHPPARLSQASISSSPAAPTPVESKWLALFTSGCARDTAQLVEQTSICEGDGPDEHVLVDIPLPQDDNPLQKIDPEGYTPSSTVSIGVVTPIIPCPELYQSFECESRLVYDYHTPSRVQQVPPRGGCPVVQRHVTCGGPESTSLPTPVKPSAPVTSAILSQGLDHVAGDVAQCLSFASSTVVMTSAVGAAGSDERAVEQHSPLQPAVSAEVQQPPVVVGVADTKDGTSWICFNCGCPFAPRCETCSEFARTPGDDRPSQAGARVRHCDACLARSARCLELDVETVLATVHRQGHLPLDWMHAYLRNAPLHRVQHQPMPPVRDNDMFGGISYPAKKARGTSLSCGAAEADVPGETKVCMDGVGRSSKVTIGAQLSPATTEGRHSLEILGLQFDPLRTRRQRGEELDDLCNEHAYDQRSGAVRPLRRQCNAAEVEGIDASNMMHAYRVRRPRCVEILNQPPAMCEAYEIVEPHRNEWCRLRCTQTEPRLVWMNNTHGTPCAPRYDPHAQGGHMVFEDEEVLYAPHSTETCRHNNHNAQRFVASRVERVGFPRSYVSYDERAARTNTNLRRRQDRSGIDDGEEDVLWVVPARGEPLCAPVMLSGEEDCAYRLPHLPPRSGRRQRRGDVDVQYSSCPPLHFEAHRTLHRPLMTEVNSSIPYLTSDEAGSQITFHHPAGTETTPRTSPTPSLPEPNPPFRSLPLSKGFLWGRSR